MESEYGMYRKGSSGWSSMVGNEEFQETDIWSVLNERKSFDSNKSSSKPICFPSAARMIPKSSSTNNNNNLEVPQQQSAPVNIPDWSKIYGKSKRSSQNSAWHDYGDDDDDDDDGHDDGRENWDSDDDDDGNMMPPHEWIAKKLARSQISSFSVCEGAGRTLKGRDLSRKLKENPRNSRKDSMVIIIMMMVMM